MDDFEVGDLVHNNYTSHEGCIFKITHLDVDTLTPEQFSDWIIHRIKRCCTGDVWDRLNQRLSHIKDSKVTCSGCKSSWEYIERQINNQGSFVSKVRDFFTNKPRR